MNIKPVVLRNVVLMVFAAIVLTKFSAHVRAVQITGLVASGAIVGAAFTDIVHAFKAKHVTDRIQSQG